MSVPLEERDSFYCGEQLISYTISRRNRRTLALSVFPSGAVEVRSPKEISQKKIREAVQKRALWIIKQQRRFQKLAPRTSPRSYQHGESHLYLGKKYRLKLEMSSQERVRLIGGCFVVELKEPAQPERVEHLLALWYRRQAQRVFEELYSCAVKQLKIETPPQLKMRQMKSRWGSYSKRGVITLNLALIKTKREAIEYVIFHELCHIEQHNHGKEFYALLAHRMPDWKGRKQLLNVFLI